MTECRVSIRRPKGWTLVVLALLVGVASFGYGTTSPAPSAYYVVDARETNSTPEAIPASKLSDEVRRTFLADMEGETVKFDFAPELQSRVVEYRGNYYQVWVGVIEPEEPVDRFLSRIGGIALVGLACLAAIVLLLLTARDLIAGRPG
jgi:hypothetical protein